VERGCTAVRAALAAQPPAGLDELLRGAGRAFAAANPSTMAALLGGGLLSAAKEVRGEDRFGPEMALRIGKAVFARIQHSGKGELGDKTILDALDPSLTVLAAGGGLPEMIEAAQGGVDATTDSPGRRGRAAWVGERGVGHPDPGASLYVAFLRAVQAASG
jgi:dihydroxyacetone kinase